LVATLKILKTRDARISGRAERKQKFIGYQLEVREKFLNNFWQFLSKKHWQFLSKKIVNRK